METEQIFFEDAREAVQSLLNGRIPKTLDTAKFGVGPAGQLAGLLNTLIESVGEAHDFIVPLSQGRLNESLPSRKNFLASPFKELHSRLKHLTWQAARVAKGDYKQRVDFMGDFAQSFNSMVVSLRDKEAALVRHHQHLEMLVAERTAELEETFEQLKQEVIVRKQAELAHAEAREVAEAANRAKSDFLANISHEIRTPMTAIVGYTDLIAEGCPKKCRLGERNMADFTEHIRRNSDHLLAVINDILDISEIEMGKMAVQRIDCSCHQVVVETVSLMSRQAAEKGLTLDVAYNSLIPETIHTDPTRLRQVLVNLIENAIKFTRHGGIRLAIHLAKPKPNGDNPQLCFEIVDTGVGMSREKISTVFEAFTQADETMTRRFGGTGLGLAISKAAVEMLGGTISAESELGKGSTFRFSIDTGPLDGVNMLQNGEEAEIVSATKPKDRKTQVPVNITASVLLCEDGPDNQRLIAFLLKKAGAEVVVADNGQIGLEKALQARDFGKPFDIIFMDMQMPVLDGYLATRRLREEGYRGPIVALTAHAMAHDRQKCLDAGCDDYASKPIDRARLVDLLVTHLSDATQAT